MGDEISAIVGNANSRYKGLHRASTSRFIEFLRKRNAGELTVLEFLSFRFFGQIALRDGLIFEENQILFRNEFFDAESVSDYIVIGCLLNYDLILLNLKTMAVLIADQWYEVSEDTLEEPNEVATSLNEFLSREVRCTKGSSEVYLVSELFDTNFKRLLDAICAAGQGGYSEPTREFLAWLERRELSANAKLLFSWFMPTHEIMVGTGNFYSAEDMMGINDQWSRMASYGLLILGSCLNGDFIVIDTRSDNLEVGYVTHEEVDLSDTSDYREKYIAISPSIDCFLHDATLLRYLPDDYYFAKEAQWRITVQEI